MNVRLIHEFRFESAHRLPKVPPGHKCARLHGHSFKVELCVVGPVNPDPAGAGSGARKNDPLRQSATPAGVTPDRRLAEPGWPTPADDAGEASTNEEIDRAMLAREFSQLLQQDDSGADG